MARVLSASETHLGTLFYEFGVESRYPGYGSRDDQALALVRGIEDFHKPDEARDIFLDIATRLLNAELPVRGHELFKIARY